MSDKTRERVRAEFEAHYSKTYNKPPHLIRDSRVRNAIVSDGYTETHQLGIDLNIAYRAWQAAKELYAPSESEGSVILKHLKRKLDDHSDEFAYHEPDTNAVVFSPREAEDYNNNLAELIEEIEAIIGDKE